MNEYIKNELERRISSSQQLPYLFVGTGFSMRYSHAPSWNTLLLIYGKCLIHQRGKDISTEELEEYKIFFCIA